MSNPLTPEQQQLVSAALHNGNVIEAIKLYRSFAKCDLVDAKNAVDRLRAERDALLPEGQRQKSGCAGMLALMITAGAASTIGIIRWLV